MKRLKSYLIVSILLLFTACSHPPPDFTGEWEHTNDEENVKRFLTITLENQKYYVIDEIKNSTSREVSYNESSNGILDGKELLTGTNLLTNVLSLDEKTQELTMTTPDESRFVFKKVSP